MARAVKRAPFPFMWSECWQQPRLRHPSGSIGPQSSHQDGRQREGAGPVPCMVPGSAGGSGRPLLSGDSRTSSVPINCLGSQFLSNPQAIPVDCQVLQSHPGAGSQPTVQRQGAVMPGPRVNLMQVRCWELKPQHPGTFPSPTTSPALALHQHANKQSLSWTKKSRLNIPLRLSGAQVVEEGLQWVMLWEPLMPYKKAPLH